MPSLPFHYTNRYAEIEALWQARVEQITIHFGSVFTINDLHYVPLEKISNGFNVIQVIRGDKAEHPFLKLIFVAGVRYYRGDRYFTVARLKNTMSDQ